MALIPLYMCIALSHLHTKQRAHNEIKPTNEWKKWAKERRSEKDRMNAIADCLPSHHSYFYIYTYNSSFVVRFFDVVFLFGRMAFFFCLLLLPCLCIYIFMCCAVLCCAVCFGLIVCFVNTFHASICEHTPNVIEWVYGLDVCLVCCVLCTSTYLAAIQHTEFQLNFNARIEYTRWSKTLPSSSNLITVIFAIRFIHFNWLTCFLFLCGPFFLYAFVLFSFFFNLIAF